MGLLDVNMPMLYGEGKKAFHRLQLEIIRTSNDQSIFAWGHSKLQQQSVFRLSTKQFIGDISNVLAGDPSFFQGCSGIEVMDHDEFIRFAGNKIPGEDLSSFNQDNFGVFPTTNRGIHNWMLLSPFRDSDFLFRAYLPCRGPSHSVVTIDLVLWKSTYYRCSEIHGIGLKEASQVRQVYLGYQDKRCNVTFEVDVSAITDKGFTEAGATQGTETLTLTPAYPYRLRKYDEKRGNGRFAVVFGQCAGQGWIHLIHKPPKFFSPYDTGENAFKGLERMVDIASRGDFHDRIWVHHICLPESTWIVQTRRVVWEKSRIGIQIEVFQDSRFRHGLDEWKAFDVEASGSLVMHMDYCHGLQRSSDDIQDMRGLMLRDTPCKPCETLEIDGIPVEFSRPYDKIQVSTHTFHLILGFHRNS